MNRKEGEKMDIKLLIRRFFAFVIDWNILFGVFMLLMYFGPGADVKYLFNPSLKMYTTPGFFLGLCWFFLYLLFKDFIFGNKSLGKLIFRLKVVDSDGKKAKFSSLILRNIPFLLTIVEGVLVLANKGVRLGDMLAKTRIANADSKKAFNITSIVAHSLYFTWCIAGIVICILYRCNYDSNFGTKCAYLALDVCGWAIIFLILVIPFLLIMNISSVRYAEGKKERVIWIVISVVSPFVIALSGITTGLVLVGTTGGV